MQPRITAKFFITIGWFFFFIAPFVLPAGAEAFWPYPLLVKKASPSVQAGPAKLLRVKIPGGEPLPVSPADRMAVEVRHLACDLVASLAAPDPDDGDLADGILVTTFVDLKRLYRTSSFGRYLGEQIMGEMQRKGYRVMEIRKSREIRIADRYGEYGLSRDPGSISPDIAAGTMLTGTYTPAGNNIVVNARILDNRSGQLLASATRIFPADPATRSMLADASVPGRERAGVLYLKNLDM